MSVASIGPVVTCPFRINKGYRKAVGPYPNSRYPGEPRKAP